MFFLVSLGSQTFTFDGQSLGRDSLNDQVTCADTATQLTNTTAPTAATLNIFQLAAFTLAFVWSSFYLVKIHIEIRTFVNSGTLGELGIVGREEE